MGSGGWADGRTLAREAIVQESGEDYTLDLGFANGRLAVNGDPFNRL